MAKPIPSAPDTLEIRELPRPMIPQPDELPFIPGGWTQCEWIIQGRSFRLTLPAVPDAFLEDPDVHAALGRDGYMPYWAFLWPSALKMVSTILSTGWPAHADVLEIGAGIGIVGLAGLSLGLNVTISDYEPKAVELALFNARQNGYYQGRGLVLDWRIPPQGEFPFLWGCDLFYEDRHHEPLLRFTKQVLAQDGVAWFADGGRIQAERFCSLVPRHGLAAQLFDADHNPVACPELGQYRLIEIRHQD